MREMVIISAEEYRELVEKAKVYDLKRAELQAAKFIIGSDAILFDLHKEE